MTSSEVWDADTAAQYDDDVADLATAAVLAPTIDYLVELAAGGAVLEFAIGTGRVAIPLHQRGVAVSGIELSQPMIDVLRTKVSPDEIPVVRGDMATTLVDGDFSLVYLVFNTISNLRTQAEQVECFRNAARHLTSGGRFVIELWVPPLRSMPPGQNAVPFDVSDGHLGFDTYDVVTQECASHHYTRRSDGSVRYNVGHFRYAWPSELDLMAQLAGLELEHRYADWDRNAFTAESTKHISAYRKPVQ
jgi:SAM-dependent methyltransferase